MSDRQQLKGSSPIGSRMIIDGREVDCFCGTSYYSLHGHPAVIDAACEATREFGLGPASIAGTRVIDRTVELARQFFDVESVSYFVSGYLGAMVFAQALADEYDVVLADEASHYSILDGMRTAEKAIIFFRHLDPDDLASKLSAHVSPGVIPLIVTDGVFPATGAIAPVRSYVDVLSSYNPALLYVDDAHAVGVIGTEGRGTLEYLGLNGDNFHFSGTLSKAFGGIGGVVPGSLALAEKIAESVHVPLGASPPPVPAAAAAAKGIQILMENPEMRQDLWANTKRMKEGLRKLGFSVDETPIPIINIPGNPSLDLEHVEAELNRQNILVLRLPAGGYSDAPDVESLRIAVFSTHSEEQIDRVIDVMGRTI
ncbi:aminotransferase class I/II-fold pyridoxal phosphate-dependent enzyme [Candidatus Bipolaricaulota bacterium]